MSSNIQQKLANYYENYLRMLKTSVKYITILKLHCLVLNLYKLNFKIKTIGITFNPLNFTRIKSNNFIATDVYFYLYQNSLW